MDVIENVKVATGRAKILQRILLVVVIVDVLGVLTGLSQWSLINRAATIGITDAEANANDARYRLVGIVQLLLFVVSAIAWLRWQHRAYTNLTLVGSKDTTHTPGMSIGWWFVPFLNLVRPFQVHREMFLRSRTQNQSSIEPTGAVPSAFSLWWGLFIVAGLLGRVALSLSERASTIPELRTLTQVVVASDVAGVVCAVAAIQVIRLVTSSQKLFRAGAPEALTL